MLGKVGGSLLRMEQLLGRLGSAGAQTARELGTAGKGAASLIGERGLSQGEKLDGFFDAARSARDSLKLGGQAAGRAIREAPGEAAVLGGAGALGLGGAAYGLSGGESDEDAMEQYLQQMRNQRMMGIA